MKTLLRRVVSAVEIKHIIKVASLFYSTGTSEIALKDKQRSCLSTRGWIIKATKYFLTDDGEIMVGLFSACWEQEKHIKIEAERKDCAKTIVCQTHTQCCYFFPILHRLFYRYIYWLQPCQWRTQREDFAEMGRRRQQWRKLRSGQWCSEFNTCQCTSCLVWTLILFDIFTPSRKLSVNNRVHFGLKRWL